MLANDYQQILQTLVNHRVDFIVIGAVSAVLNGAPLNTFDVDVVHSREPENVDRLLAALKELDAFYRFQPERRIRPDTSHLISPGHQLLQTKFGHADFLGSVTKQRTYQESQHVQISTFLDPLRNNARTRTSCRTRRKW